MTKHKTDQNAVIITHHNGVTSCTLNRPDKLNALNADMVEGLLQAMKEATAKDSQLVVFQGAGRAFCAGFDLSDLADMSDADLLFRFVRIETLLQAIYTARMPTLALVHGRCFGAGADIVASCSQRIASADSSFRMPGLQFGIVLGTRRLAALIGGDAKKSLAPAISKPASAANGHRKSEDKGQAEVAGGVKARRAAPPPPPKA